MDNPPSPKSQDKGPIVRDFFIGLAGWFAIHSLYWVVLSTTLASGAILLGLMCPYAPIPLNAIVLIRLWAKRRWVVLGALGAIITNLVGWTIINLIVEPSRDISFVIFTQILFILIPLIPWV